MVRCKMISKYLEILFKYRWSDLYSYKVIKRIHVLCLCLFLFKTLERFIYVQVKPNIELHIPSEQTEYEYCQFCLLKQFQILFFCQSMVSHSNRNKAGQVKRI